MMNALMTMERKVNNALLLWMAAMLYRCFPAIRTDRGGKYSIFEGGTRIPFIICWPNTIQLVTSDVLICQMDLLASSATMLQQPVLKVEALDSEN